MKKTKRLITIMTTILINHSVVFAGEDIGAPGAGMFAQLGQFMQDTVDFCQGPLAMWALVICGIVAIILWNTNPGNSQWIGRTIRWVASGFMLGAIGIIIGRFF